MRYWNNRQQDDGSIHAIGNGFICAYGQGPNLLQIFGSPYSLPSVMNICLADVEYIETKSQRMASSAVWTHEIRKNGCEIGTITDFTYNGKACFIRTLNLTSSLAFKLINEKNCLKTSNSKIFSDSNITSVLFTADAGTYFYADLYPSPYKAFYQICFKGNIQLTKEKDTNSFQILCAPGQSEIIICGGTVYPQCIENSKFVLNSDVNKILESTIHAQNEFSKKKLDFNSLIPDKFPDKQNLLKAIDDITMLIYAQADQSGSFLAGHNYHLAYVRDQFGVIRCLLDLGYSEAAKQNLRYYFDIWQRYNKISNAQSLGFDGIFHVHENDEVEITGSLIIQAFDYLKKTNDNEFIIKILPMLKWAFEAQLKHLKDYMLPFNGDETYIAGGILPRSVLNDGSSEATLLFITSGNLLLNYIEKYDSWDKLVEYQKILDETRKHYRNNFFQNGELIANNPKRKKHLELPEFRHGVCECCNAFGWTNKNENDRYLCVSCFEAADLTKADDKIYSLLSVGLVPVFIGSDVFKKDEIESILSKIMLKYEKEGTLPSGSGSGNSVGYDYGFLLYALSYFKHPKTYEVYQKMMKLLDQTGSWVEYYIGEKPSGTRCRPWESGINLSAAIRFALNY